MPAFDNQHFFSAVPRSPLAVEGVGIVHSLGTQDSLRQRWAQHPLPAYVPSATPPDCSQLHTLFPKAALRRLPRYAQMGLLAAHRAFYSAQEHREVDKAHTALVVASAHTCVTMGFDFMDSILNFGPHLSSPTAFSHAVNNMGAGLISLLMELRGPCTTVTQFELSFAGALQTAAALLYNHSVTRVLVGAVEELDDRWQALSSATASSSMAEGAIFFSLSLQQNTPCTFDIPHWSACCPSADEGEYPLFVSGAAQAPHARNLHTFYGESPLAHALDCFFMGEYLHTIDQTHGLCVCADSTTRRHATIAIRKHICTHGH